jgi:nicotinamidase-related amidase
MTTIELPAQPHAVQLDLSRTALLLIDMQADFLLPNGYGAFLGNDVNLLHTAIAPCQQVLASARQHGLLVVHTREGHLPDLSDCPPTKLNRWPAGQRIGDIGPMGRILVQGEPGHAIIGALAPLPNEIVLDKPGKSAFYATPLAAILQQANIQNVLIAGVTTDVCCFATTIAANDYGYNAVVLADCVASYDTARHQNALATIAAQGGIFGWVSHSHALLSAFDALDRAATTSGA